MVEGGKEQVFLDLYPRRLDLALGEQVNVGMLDVRMRATFIDNVVFASAHETSLEIFDQILGKFRRVVEKAHAIGEKVVVASDRVVYA